MNDLELKVSRKINEINNTVLYSFNERNRKILMDFGTCDYVGGIVNQIINFASTILRCERTVEYHYYDYINKTNACIKFDPNSNNDDIENLKGYMNYNCINFKGLKSYKEDVDDEIYYNACMWVVSRIDEYNIFNELKRRYAPITHIYTRSIIPPALCKKMHKWCLVFEEYGIDIYLKLKDKVERNTISPLYYKNVMNLTFKVKKEEFINKHWWINDIANRKEFSGVEEFENGELVRVNGRRPCLTDDFFDYDTTYRHSDKVFEINRRRSKYHIKIEKIINRKEVLILK